MVTELALLVTSSWAAMATTGAAALRHRLRHDPLTGLPNRACLRQRFHRARRRGQGMIAVAIGDLNKFKQVNDEHGHLFGDRVLCAVAEILRITAKQDELVVRLHGDEFALLLTGENRASLERRVAEFQRAVSRISHVDGVEVDVDIALGVMSSPSNEADLSKMLGSADDRMYGDKHSSPGAAALVLQ